MLIARPAHLVHDLPFGDEMSQPSEAHLEKSGVGELWPGWRASPIAVEAYGPHLRRTAELIPALLLRYLEERVRLLAGQLDIGFDVQLEHREDLMETAVAMDLIALCQGPGAYLPRPYQDGPDVSFADELRHDAVTLADHLVRYDHQHDGGRTRTLPPSLPAQPDAQAQEDVRAYARREWLYFLTADFADLINPRHAPDTARDPHSHVGVRERGTATGPARRG